MRRAHVAILVAAMAVSACSGRNSDGETNLRDLRTFSGSPEEFSIVPRKPLQQPEDVAQLPPPTPGGANRTDQTPLEDAVIALGGNPERATGGDGIGAGDQAIVARASRFGRDPTIRESLAAEDRAFRQRQSRFTWSILPTDEYNRAYRRQALDPYDWLDRYRRAGARTPAAPPPER